MIVILSPAKKIEKKKLSYNIDTTKPRFMKEAKELNNRLKELNPDELASTMKIGEKILVKHFLVY